MQKNAFRFPILFCLLLASLQGIAQSSIDGLNPNYWRSVAAIPNATLALQPAPIAYSSWELLTSLCQNHLFAAGQSPTQSVLLQIPAPDGKLMTFRVWRNEVMSAELSKKYPNIQTYSGEAVADKFSTLRINISPKGFHAFVLSNAGSWLIDPAFLNGQGNVYISYYKKDYQRELGNALECLVKEEEEKEMTTAAQRKGAQLRTNGGTLKSYRLALSCTEEYAAAVDGPTPTRAGVLAAMALSVNRVDGVYRRELAVTLQLIGNTDTLIFLPGSNDPFTNGSGSNMLGQNQTTVTNRIGSGNYDIGHVFSTGGGGIASLGCVCKSTQKAQGVTGSSNPVGDAFDIDYVAHEMGHQFGGDHTFNANTGSCNGNGARTSAYEPGSGLTIMAYAGICGNSDNTAAHSIPFFHARSLDQITSFITTGAGSGCPISSVSNNVPPALPPFTSVYNIPLLTPFELTAPAAVDADHDTLTYSWEQYNLGDFRSSWSATRLLGPTFRNFVPDTSSTRVFPKISAVLAGITNYLGEKLPDTGRKLTFRLTVRDIYNGLGSYNFANDSVVLNAISGTGPFKVTSPLGGATVYGGSQMMVTWDVAGTDLPPINTSTVDIYLSEDGGYTFPYLLVSATPNDGNQRVILPNISTSATRIKVKGSANVYFNINPGNFVMQEDNSVAKLTIADLQVYPVPAHHLLHIRTAAGAALEVQLLNTLGQQMWQGTCNGQQDINTSSLARGVYYLKVSDKATGAGKVIKVGLE